MIDQTNYETWFFMYADNELSADERLLVEEFVQNNPDYKKQFHLIQQIKFQPEHVDFPDTSVLLSDQISLNDLKFEADTSIVYPSKKELYRQASHEKRRSYLPIAIAASMLLLIGLFILFKQDTKAPVLIPLAKNIDKVPSESQKVIASSASISTSKQPKRITASTKLSNKKMQVSDVVFPQDEPLVDEIIVESKSEETILSTSPSLSNLSEDVIRAAESRMGLLSQPQQDPIAINTAMIIEASAKTNEQGRLRSLFRKLSRQIFKEKENGDQEKVIQVASFVIPVANKK